MNTVLLISEAYVKENSPVYQNVDPKVIQSHIFESQNINLKYLLPEDLYDEIFDEYEAYRVYRNDGGTDPIADQVPARIIALVNQCKPMLLYYTLYNAAFSLYTRITNKGINTQHSDYSDDVDISIFESMRKDWKQKAQNYASLVNEFMYDNSDTYPEYNNGDCNCDNNSSCTSCGVKSAFSNPLYLGKNI